MRQTLKIIALSALATGALIKAIPASAESAAAQNVKVVHTADLDLSTLAGRQALDHRLITAVAEVCGPASNVDLVGRNRVRTCRADVLAKARSDGTQLAKGGTTIRVASAN